MLKWQICEKKLLCTTTQAQRFKYESATTLASLFVFDASIQQRKSSMHPGIPIP